MKDATEVFDHWAVIGKDEGMEKGHAAAVKEMLEFIDKTCIKPFNAIDIGCGNGYYLFRLSEYSPKLSIGIDPTIQFLMQFHAIQQTCQYPNIAILPMGYEDLHLLHLSFDIMLCMGLYYHHPCPTQLLKTLWNHLPKKGVLIIETLILTTDTQEALRPKKRYANMKNISEIPSISRLTQQLKQTGFKDITVIDITETRHRDGRKFTKLNWESYCR